MTYDLGGGVNLDHFVQDRDRKPAAATVTLVVTRPDGTTVTPAISSPTLGDYRAETVLLDQVGPWSYVWNVTGAIIDRISGDFTVADPGPPPYAGLQVVKSSLGKITNDDRDDLIASSAQASSRMIDERTGRRFYLDDEPSARVFTGSRAMWDRYLGAYVIAVDDIGDAAGLVIEVGSSAIGAWSPVTGYRLGPDNALARGRAVTTLIMPTGWAPGLWGWELRVTARWGWPAIPAQIAEAGRLLAARLYRRKDSPQGVLGSAEWGVARVSRFDPDVESLIAPFILAGFA